MEVKRTQTERSDTTRARLTEAARDLFAERGYANTSTDEVARRAGVSKGALYHHFRDKADVFAAVFEQLQDRIGRDVMKAAGEADPPGTWKHLMAGVEAFLDICLEPAIQRIVLIDAPAALGWERWREIDARHGHQLIRRALEVAMDAGLIARQPVEPLANLLLGALNEAALSMVRADDVDEARRQTGATLERILRGLA